jgi:hypothetical protein
MWTFRFFQKEREKNGSAGFMKCFEKEERKGNFTVFESLKVYRQTFFKYRIFR